MEAVEHDANLSLRRLIDGRKDLLDETSLQDWKFKMEECVTSLISSPDHAADAMQLLIRFWMKQQGENLSITLNAAFPHVSHSSTIR